MAVQMMVVLGVLAACFSGPALALYLLILRKRQVRRIRRSPLNSPLLRSPGYTLREQLDEASFDLISLLMLLMLVPLTALTLFLAQGHVRGLASMVRVAPVLAVVVGAFVLYVVRMSVRAGSRLDRLKAGYDAEVAIGQELDQLVRRGAVAFHDIPADNFNIDHVVISRDGVFAIETKGFTKPKLGRGRADATVVFDGKLLEFPTWSTRKPLDQAERQAAWLARWLTSAVGSPVRVHPVVALPGWFVKRTGRGHVSVFNGKELTEWLLKSRGAQRISSQDVERIAHQVAQRCRTVTPRFAESESAG